MEDQFGGRTDDDLFYDDFEPVESESVLSRDETEPFPFLATSVPASISGGTFAHAQYTPKKPSPPTGRNAGAAPKAQTGNLASSRFARKGNNSKQQQKSTPPPPPKDKPKAKNAVSPKQDASSPPPSAPTGPAKPVKEKKSQGPQNTAARPEARLQSGANPRQKLTDTELAAKMEQMKLLSAEKARKFEKAEKDEKKHAEAYAKGMEEARKRRAEDAERRRRGEENQRKLDDERAKNRERKLKAMGMKEGGWDEGKEAALEEEARRGFRGANGGIRGAKRRGGGLGESRYAASRQGDEQRQQEPDVDRFLDQRHRGRGGRGGRGRGRDNSHGGSHSHGQAVSDGLLPSKLPEAPSLTADEFPALPSDGVKRPAPVPVYPPAPPSKSEPAPMPSLLSPPPAGSKWDDEMEALDQLGQKEQA